MTADEKIATAKALLSRVIMGHTITKQEESIIDGAVVAVIEKAKQALNDEPPCPVCHGTGYVDRSLLRK